MLKPKPTRASAPVAKIHPTITLYETGVAARLARGLAANLTAWAEHLERGEGGPAWGAEAAETIYRMIAAGHGCTVETVARMDLLSCIHEQAGKVRDAQQPLDEAVSAVLLRYRDTHPWFVAEIDKAKLGQAIVAWGRDHKKWAAVHAVLPSAGLDGPSAQTLRQEWADWKQLTRLPGGGGF